MVLCYSTSNETDIYNICFSSSLHTLPSIRSSGRSNHVRWLLVHLLFSRQQPNMRQIATRTIACGSHHTPAGTRTAADCSSQPAAVGVVPLLQITQSHPSRLNHNPPRRPATPARLDPAAGHRIRPPATTSSRRLSAFLLPDEQLQCRRRLGFRATLDLGLFFSKSLNF